MSDPKTDEYSWGDFEELMKPDEPAEEVPDFLSENPKGGPEGNVGDGGTFVANEGDAVDPGQQASEYKPPTFEEYVEIQKRQKELEDLVANGAKSVEWARNLALSRASEAASFRKLLQKAVEDGELDEEEARAALKRSAGGSPAQTPFGPQPQSTGGEEEDFAAAAAGFAMENRLAGERLANFQKFLTDPNNGLSAADYVHGNPRATLAIAYSKFRDIESKYNTQARVSAVKMTQAAQRGAMQMPQRRPSPPPAPTSQRKMSVKEFEESPEFDSIFRQWKRDQGF